jgi:hypothetical protein
MDERNMFLDKDSEEYFKVDANYAKMDWEEKQLDGMTSKSTVALGVPEETNKIKGSKSNEEDDDLPGGTRNIPYALLKWHHEGGWPIDGAMDWSAPIDPFDTKREHHIPAAHYVRVYCQEMHYSFGWRIMSYLQLMFKAGIRDLKNHVRENR